MPGKFSSGSKAVGLTEPPIASGDAPMLSEPGVNEISNLGGVPHVITDQATGTIYMVIVLGNEPVTNAQVIAGTDSSDAGAWAASSKAVTLAGEQQMPAVTSLEELTGYDVIFVHVNAGGVDSDQSKFFLSTPAAPGGG